MGFFSRSKPRVTVAIAMGSNLGDRTAHLDGAVRELERILKNVRVSELILTQPVDVPDDQPPYLNGALVGETSLEPEALLAELMRIERAYGRTRPSPRAARTLDLDLILYGDRVIRTPDLEIPHPRFRDRLFVLDPIADVAPELVDPVTGLTVQALLDKARAV